MRPTIGIVGAGSWGTTLAKIIGENERPALLWAYEPEIAEQINAEHRNARYLPEAVLPDTVVATNDLAQIGAQCDFILLAVPSHLFRGVVARLGDFLDGNKILVHGTKGIEEKTGQRMSEILRAETGVRKIGVLTGPNIAGEIAQRQPAGTLIASAYEEVVRRTQEILHNQYFRVYSGDDVIGAEIAGAFKNILALAAGVAVGLGLGENTKALLLSRGLYEMALYGVSQGANIFTFGGMAGLGDLMATCGSPLSRNRQVGERLARGETLAQIEEKMFMVAEGIRTTRAIHDYARAHHVELALVRSTYEVLFENKKVSLALEDLMARDSKREFIWPAKIF